MWIAGLLNELIDFLFDLWIVDRLVQRRRDDSSIVGDSPLEQKLERERRIFFRVLGGIGALSVLAVGLAAWWLKRKGG